MTDLKVIFISINEWYFYGTFSHWHFGRCQNDSTEHEGIPID